MRLTEPDAHHMIYLDNAATTPPHPDVLDTFQQVYQKFWANPHSLHRLGERAEKLLDQARAQICSLLRANNYRAFFTSGATESINLALKGTMELYHARGNHIITTNAEHPATSATLAWLARQGCKVTALPVNSDGCITADQVEAALTDKTVLVSLIHVNNESGTINPLPEIAERLRTHQALLHTDSVQAIGKIPVHLDTLPVDLLSLSAHKFGGLKGSGALLVRQPIDLPPQLHGGGQEQGVRSGTGDVPRAAALAKALRLAIEAQPAAHSHATQLNTILRDTLSTHTGIQINSPHDASPYILNASMTGIRPETLLHALSEKDIFISTVSACSSKRTEPSHVILAMTGDAERAQRTIRISLAPQTSLDDIHTFLTTFTQLTAQLR
jgi:cysteine desulfurase